VEYLKAVVPLLMDKAAFARWWSNEAIDGCSVSNIGSCYVEKRAICQLDTRKTNDRCTKRSEVAAQPGSNTTGMVWVQSDDRAKDNSLRWKNQSVVSIDRIDKFRLNWLPQTHRQMILDLNGKRSSCWKSNALGHAGSSIKYPKAHTQISQGHRTIMHAEP
jgi:hypothetical protein